MCNQIELDYLTSESERLPRPGVVAAVGIEKLMPLCLERGSAVGTQALGCWALHPGREARWQVNPAGSPSSLGNHSSPGTAAAEGTADGLSTRLRGDGLSHGRPTSKRPG